METLEKIGGYELKIDCEYFTKADRIEEFKLCFIGRDPYPNDANGIPLSKDKMDRNCSGYFLLKALGKEGEINNLKSKEIFMNLLDEKVIFLNASYYFLNLNGNSLSIKNHNCQL